MHNLFTWIIVIATVAFAVFYWDVLFDMFPRQIERWKKTRKRTVKDYARIFESRQYGRFVVWSGYHSFYAQNNDPYFLLVQLLPKGVKAEIKEGWAINEGALNVYGRTRPRHYGWLHEGPWVKDFEKLANKLEAELTQKKADKDRLRKESIEKEIKHTQELIDAYAREWTTE